MGGGRSGRGDSEGFNQQERGYEVAVENYIKERLKVACV